MRSKITRRHGDEREGKCWTRAHVCPRRQSTVAEMEEIMIHKPRKHGGKLEEELEKESVRTDAKWRKENRDR